MKRPRDLESLEARQLLTTTVISDAPNVDFEVTNSWTSGHQADFVLVNDESVSYSHWQLEFDYEGAIDNLWNAEIENLGGGRYRITPPSWDTTFDAGESLAIGFVGDGPGSAPRNISFLADVAPPNEPADPLPPVNTPPSLGNSAINIDGVDVDGQALQITIDQATFEYDLSVIDRTAIDFSVATNNSRVVDAEIVGDGLLRVTGLTAGRASLKLTDSVSGAVRFVGIRVRTDDGQLPGLPDYVSIGSVSEDIPGDLAFWRDYDSGDPLTNKFVDSRYIYLPGGPFFGWRNWGDRVGSYVRESLKLGMIPQFVYYNIPDGGESFYTNTQHINSTSYMEAYFRDLKFALDTIQAEAGDELVQMILEPDFLGYLMQQAGAPASQLSAVTSAAYSSGVLTQGVDPQFDNTVAGLVRSINYTISKYAPNVEFGWQFNLWASPGVENPIPGNGIVHLTDTMGIDAGRAAIAREAELIAEYYIETGILSYGADFISLDKYGLDAGAQNGAATNPAGSIWFWNSDHWHNYLLFVSTLTQTTQREMVLWQIPVGHINNSLARNPYDAAGNFDALDNTFQNYEDSAPSFFFGDRFTAEGARLDYFSTNEFGDADLTVSGNTITWGSHMDEARDAGVRQILFGAGVGASTDSIGSEPTDDYWWITKVQQYYETPTPLDPGSADPSIQISGATVREGDGGVNLASFTVTLSSAASEPVSVRYQTAPGTATADDFDAASGTLVFAPGETSRSINVRVLGDTRVENDETFSVILSNASQAVISNGSAVGTILDDDQPPSEPQPSLSIVGATLDEGDVGDLMLAEFQVSLDTPSSVPVSVNYQTFGGTATEDEDYAAATGTITFAPGETSKSVHVRLLGDSSVEADESFEVRLSNPVGAVLADGMSSAAGVIRNDDHAPPSIDPSVTLNITDAWNTGFQASIALRNESDSRWQGWTLEFTFDGDITSIWNAEIVSRIGDVYTIRNAAWNASVAPGAAIDFGFIGQPTSGDGRNPDFDNFRLNERL